MAVTRRTNQRASRAAHRRQPAPSAQPLTQLFIDELTAFHLYILTDSTIRLDESIEQELLRLWRGWRSKTFDTAIDSAAKSIARVADQNFTRVTGINPIAPANAINFRATNLKLIQDVLTRDHVDRLIDLFATGDLTGLSVEAQAEVINRTVGVSASKAEFWAVDQTLKFNADVAQQRAKAAGLLRYIWRANPDERLRADHRALDGKTFAYDVPPIVDQRSGRREPPGKDFRCRCIAEPLLE